MANATMLHCVLQYANADILYELPPCDSLVGYLSQDIQMTDTGEL